LGSEDLMMNLTTAEEKALLPKLKSTIPKRTYHKPRFLCEDKHELAMLYSRLTSSSSLKRIKEFFYCPTCNKVYTKSEQKAKIHE
jgi:hypothetical protein